MRKNKDAFTSEKLVETVIFGILEKKGLEITKIDFSEMPNSICKYFVICQNRRYYHDNQNERTRECL